jgi:hypothetical protein
MIVGPACGTKPMSYLYRPNVRPVAFTNPIGVGCAARARGQKRD